jgi:hypothetical protein
MLAYRHRNNAFFQGASAMRAWKTALLLSVVVTGAAAQSPEPPLADTRLTVHTLLREDVFAGFLDDNMERVARAEKNIELLLQQRPDQRAPLLAWKAGIAMHKAVRAHEAGKAGEFATYFKDARDEFADAAAHAEGGGPAAITGGTYAVFADRLPQEYRAAAWAQAYDSYSQLWKAQAAEVDKLPLHLKGELLAGMAQSAQRTGHAAESAEFVDRILTLLPGTPFERAAKRWKADPASAATSNLTCKNCHGAGRLSARLAELNGK